MFMPIDRQLRVLFLALSFTFLLPSVSSSIVWAQESGQEAATEETEEDDADGEEEDGDAEEAAAQSVQPSNAPFMKPLGRLSTILGSVHFLRTLCGDADASVWRQKMGELLEAQSPNEADRRTLIASFNSGYRAFESTYRECTPAARLAVSRYQEEGAALSREISTRYGN